MKRRRVPDRPQKELSPAHGRPAEVITDSAAALARAIDELLPKSFRTTEQCENDRCEGDRGPWRSRPHPMPGLMPNRTASVVIRDHEFIQSLRRGHHELGVDANPTLRLAAAFDETQVALWVIRRRRMIPHALSTPSSTVLSQSTPLGRGIGSSSIHEARRDR